MDHLILSANLPLHVSASSHTTTGPKWQKGRGVREGERKGQWLRKHRDCSGKDQHVRCCHDTKIPLVLNTCPSNLREGELILSQSLRGECAVEATSWRQECKAGVTLWRQSGSRESCIWNSVSFFLYSHSYISVRRTMLPILGWLFPLPPTLETSSQT